MLQRRHCFFLLSWSWSVWTEMKCSLNLLTTLFDNVVSTAPFQDFFRYLSNLWSRTWRMIDYLTFPILDSAVNIRILATK